MCVLVKRRWEGAPPFSEKTTLYFARTFCNRELFCLPYYLYMVLSGVFERCVAFCTALQRFVRHLHPFHLIKPQPGGIETPNRLACTRLTLDAAQHQKRAECQTYGLTNTSFSLASPAEYGYHNASRALNAREKNWEFLVSHTKNDTLKCP